MLRKILKDFWASCLLILLTSLAEAGVDHGNPKHSFRISNAEITHRFAKAAPTVFTDRTILEYLQGGSLALELVRDPTSFDEDLWRQQNTQNYPEFCRREVCGFLVKESEGKIVEKYWLRSGEVLILTTRGKEITSAFHNIDLEVKR